MPRKAKPQTWGRRAKAPQAPPWMRTSQGHIDRSSAARSEAADSRALDRKLDEILGRADYVGDLMEECGYGRR
jgi:hypothetical protein